MSIEITKERLKESLNTACTDRNIIEPDELIALGMLHDASQYIAAQFDERMTRAQAKANLEARAIVFGLCNRIFKAHGCGVSREEIEGAAILEES